MEHCMLTMQQRWEEGKTCLIIAQCKALCPMRDESGHTWKPTKKKLQEKRQG